MTRTEALEECERFTRLIASWECHNIGDLGDPTCRDEHPDDVGEWCSVCLAGVIVEKMDAPSSPASPECRHGRTMVDCANGETDATCLDCGAVWLDDGQGWRRASSKGGR